MCVVWMVENYHKGHFYFSWMDLNQLYRKPLTGCSMECFRFGYEFMHCCTKYQISLNLQTKVEITAQQIGQD